MSASNRIRVLAHGMRLCVIAVTLGLGLAALGQLPDPDPQTCYKTVFKGPCGALGNSGNGVICGPGQPVCYYETYWAGNYYDCEESTYGASSCVLWPVSCKAYKQRWKCEAGLCVPDGAVEVTNELDYWKAAMTHICDQDPPSEE